MLNKRWTLGRTHLAHLRDEHGRNVREEDFLRAFTWAIDETIARARETRTGRK